MAEPTIVPPTPAVRQGEQPQSNQPAPGEPTVASILETFDRVLPHKGPKKPAEQPRSPENAPPPSAPATPEPGEQTQPARGREDYVRWTPDMATPGDQNVDGPTEPLPSTREPSPSTEKPHLPSFLESALTGDTPPAAPPAAVGEEIPEELPEFANADERKAKHRAWRASYKALKDENEGLKSRAPGDPQLQERFTTLETENKELRGRMAVFDVTQNQEFQERILKPMTSAWGEAVRIVKDAGGSPEALRNALQLTGREQYQALDEIYENLPDSATIDAQAAVKEYKRLNEMRLAALKDAPNTALHLRKRELERQKGFIETQRKEMGTLFENAVRRLREEGQVEVLQKGSREEDAWWNEQGDNLVALGRNLFLENADMGKMAMACVLAPMADVYRKLFHAERAARLKAEQTLSGKFSREPVLTESGGARPIQSNGTRRNVSEDLKRPVKDVFLEMIHAQEGR